MTIRNEPAIRLYKSAWFVVEGVLKDEEILEDGTFADSILMAKFTIEKSEES